MARTYNVYVSKPEPDFSNDGLSFSQLEYSQYDVLLELCLKEGYYVTVSLGDPED